MVPERHIGGRSTACVALFHLGPTIVDDAERRHAAVEGGFGKQEGEIRLNLTGPVACLTLADGRLTTTAFGTPHDILETGHAFILGNTGAASWVFAALAVGVRPSWFPMRWSGVSNLVTVAAAAVALALSVVNFLELRWRNRTASLSARWETYKPPPFTSDYQEYRKAAWLSGLQFDRVVVTNYGPAVAHDVSLRLLEGEVDDLERHVFPVPLLHSGQEIHAEILKTAEQEGPRSVELSWNDKRRGRQTRSVWLSPQQLI